MGLHLARLRATQREIETRFARLLTRACRIPRPCVRTARKCSGTEHVLDRRLPLHSLAGDAPARAARVCGAGGAFDRWSGMPPFKEHAYILRNGVCSRPCFTHKRKKDLLIALGRHHQKNNTHRFFRNYRRHCESFGRWRAKCNLKHYSYDSTPYTVVFVSCVKVVFLPATSPPLVPY